MTLGEYESRTEWEKRAEELLLCIMVSTGLWPAPEKCPLNARVFDQIQREDYTVAKVHFESFPGFLVTGNLYAPADCSKRFPGVLCPHGHWSHGRLEDSGTGSVPGRCINLARQGYVVFTYDMIGYNDSMQFPHRTFAEPRKRLWGINLMGLQLWNSIRSLDFLISLPYVDPERIGCTGASGGGTQTFMLMAVDKRVKVAAPVNMISAHFQGGCLCENAPGLRIDACNLEFAAMMAPRPLLLVSCTGDWTRNTPEVEYPALKRIYSLYGAEDRIGHVQVDAGHNYNKESREAVYEWFSRWLKQEPEDTVTEEKPFQVEATSDLRVFAEGPPETYPSGEEITEQLINDRVSQLRSFWPGGSQHERFTDVMKPLLQRVMGVVEPGTGQVYGESGNTWGFDSFTVEQTVIGRRDSGDKIPALLYTPDQGCSARPVLVIPGTGKEALVDPCTCELHSPFKELLTTGHPLLAIDPFLTGEYHQPGVQAGRLQMVDHITTYNPTDAACRVQDVVTAAVYLSGVFEHKDMAVIGLGRGGLWSMLAAPFSTSCEICVVDCMQFDLDDDAAFVRELYIPGLRRAGDVRTAIALFAPGRLMLHNTGAAFDSSFAQSVYRDLGCEENCWCSQDLADPRIIVDFIRDKRRAGC